jgi:hypothetical protein
VIATFVIVTTTNIKETYWDKVRDKLRQETALADARTAEAARDAAAANKEAADLKLKSLELEKQLQARDIDRESFRRIMADVPRAKIEILDSREGSDTWWLAMRISGMLGSMGWPLVTPLPQTLGGDNSELCKHLPPLQWMGGQPFGVTVLTSENASAEETAARDKLVKAFAESLRFASGSTHESVPKETIRILVGPKP